MKKKNNTPNQSFGLFPTTFPELTNEAVRLLREHEPKEGYLLAFSGGKDSIVIKELARLAGVKFTAQYNNTTIDPPELIQYIRKHHPDVVWKQPKHGSMMHRVATRSSLPPTRQIRWCCAEYKESGTKGFVGILGVRAEESVKRANRWSDISKDVYGGKVVCPIVHWTDSQVWEFIRTHHLPYCSLYDEGWTRLGCVGCPLVPDNQKKEFQRWPKYAQNWEKAVKQNWETYHNKTKKDGELYGHHRWKTAEDFWQWWLTAKKPSYMLGDCQAGFLFTNEDLFDLESHTDAAIEKMEKSLKSRKDS